ncbi:MAG: FlgD immunoglobulin-like domain containing protein, partial [Elusimicrobiota bacterium]
EAKGAAGQGFGGAYVSGGSESGQYNIFNLSAGEYVLTARAPGFGGATRNLTVANTDLFNVEMPTMTTGAKIVGTVTVTGSTRTLAQIAATDPEKPGYVRVFVNAWSPQTYQFGFAETLFLAADMDTLQATVILSTTVALKGLDAGTYTIDSFIAGSKGDFSPSVSNPKSATLAAGQPQVDFGTVAYVENTGRIDLTVKIPAGSSDFGNVMFFLKDVNSDWSESMSALGFDGVDLSVPSQASMSVAHGDQELEVVVTYLTTGASIKRRLSLKNGQISSQVLDFSVATQSYEIAGAITNKLTDPDFNTFAGIRVNGINDPPAGYPATYSTTTARVIATKRDFSSFATEVDVSIFDSVNSRIGFISDAGTYTIRGLTPGTWIVRTIDIKDEGGLIVAPAQEKTVTVIGQSVSGVDFSLTEGFTVSGALAYANSVEDARRYFITVRNSRGEIVRSTFTAIGDPLTGTPDNSVDYSFTNLPAGGFYTVTVQALTLPAKYSSRPLRVPDPATTPGGLQASMSNQNIELTLGGVIMGKLRDANSGLTFTSRNKDRLPKGFKIYAVANPWVDGGFAQLISTQSFMGVAVETRNLIDENGNFKLGPIITDAAYDLHIEQERWDFSQAAQGSINFTPVVKSGIVLVAGQTKDLGDIDLTQGVAVKGVVKDGAGNVLANLTVRGVPVGANTFVNEVRTDGSGAYKLWVSSALSKLYDITAAPRERSDEAGTSAASSVFAPQTIRVDLNRTMRADFRLNRAGLKMKGKIATSDGAPLSYPFGNDNVGFPGASVHLQPQGVAIVGKDPLGDIEVITGPDGSFNVPRLSTGVYIIRAASLGYSVKEATFSVSGGASNEVDIGTVTVTQGATVKGAILKVDPTVASGYSAPRKSEVFQVLAANQGFTEFVTGRLEVDPVTETITKYQITGFEPGVTYSIGLAAEGTGDLVFPQEGANVVFAQEESTATKSIDLTYKPNTVDIRADLKAQAIGSDEFVVTFMLSKPLRNQTDLDSDLDGIFVVSSYTKSGTLLSTPDSTGTLGSKELSTDRKKLTAIYTKAAGEGRFSVLVRARLSEKDAATGESILLEKVFDFYTNITLAANERISNMAGGSVALEAGQDENEKSELNFEPGTFTSTDTLTAAPTLQVDVGIRRSTSTNGGVGAGAASRGMMAAIRETMMLPNSVPEEMGEAMRALLASEVSVNPLSSFYEIFLPAGISTQLKRKAALTLTYDPTLVTTAALNTMNVFYYNTLTKQYSLEDNGKAIDATNKTITVNVDHFSTFVVLASTPVATSTTVFAGAGIEVYNFPNPFDLTTKTKSLNTNPGSGSFTSGQSITTEGTIIRFTLPAAVTGVVRIRIYDVTGDLIREIDNGELAGGAYYYQVWDGRNHAGKQVASGVYIGELSVAGQKKFFKMAVIR